MRFCLPWLCLALAACSQPAIDARWQPLTAPVLVFRGVTLPAAARDPAYPAVCREAVRAIDTRLRRELPARLRPVALRATPPAGDDDYVLLDIVITRCRLDVDQWGDDFDFFLDLNLKVTLRQGQRVVLRRTLVTGERARTDTPSPDWLFTFADASRQILDGFENGRVRAAPTDPGD